MAQYSPRAPKRHTHVTLPIKDDVIHMSPDAMPLISYKSSNMLFVGATFMRHQDHSLVYNVANFVKFER
jgi:hypothetical protein